eukprot:TRINITY_DN14864_c0_g1_i1.p1 TRINITY_DN14864_c0_g1~~TRINITY_DN14864_c0_g1_i1.p1  ORF type:complete len:131 (-),score=14.92 TRINITY_DN14864_c0_g1_i1:37-387(-)
MEKYRTISSDSFTKVKTAPDLPSTLPKLSTKSPLLRRRSSGNLLFTRTAYLPEEDDDERPKTIRLNTSLSSRSQHRTIQHSASSEELLSLTKGKKNLSKRVSHKLRKVRKKEKVKM